jgi:hypothetical protein
MKSQHIIYLSLILAGTACSRNNVNVHGTCAGGSGSVISLERLDVNRTTVIDSTIVSKNGTFSFSTRLEDPELFVLKNRDGEVLNLLLSPGDNVSVSTSTGSFSNGYLVEGSEESENIRMLVERLALTRRQLDSILSLADDIQETESPEMEQIRSEYARIIVAQKRYNIQYMVTHMTSLSSVYAMYQKYDEQNLVMGKEADLPYFRVLADSMESFFPNSSLTRSLRADIENREARYKQQRQMNTLLGMAREVTGILDITIPDRDGKEIVLSSLKGNVILVVFWASGNEQSVASMLRLKSTYSLYHDRGFEVYAISLDNNRYRWMNAIDFNEFAWINVSELTYPDSYANKLYNVRSLPASYLINREGDIVARDLYGRTLETWLDNLI